MDISKLKAFLLSLTEMSAEVIRLYFRQPHLKVELKADTSPVTAADRETEARLRECIHRRYPEHGIIGEEFGKEREQAEWAWVLDPIDGTRSFIAGVPLFATLIGLLYQGRPLIGVIDQPILNQTCLGDNETATLNNHPIHVSPTSRLSDALLLTTDTTTVPLHQDQAGWERLVTSTRLLRTWGDAYGYLLVATGRADIMVDPIMNPWDLLPLIPIIRGAGGVFSDWQGKDPITATSSLATNPLLYPQVIEKLNLPPRCFQ